MSGYRGEYHSGRGVENLRSGHLPDPLLSWCSWKTWLVIRHFGSGVALREEITGKFCSQIMIIPNRAVSPTTENFCRKPGQLTVLERFFLNVDRIFGISQEGFVEREIQGVQGRFYLTNGSFSFWTDSLFSISNFPTVPGWVRFINGVAAGGFPGTLGTLKLIFFLVLSIRSFY